MRRRKVLARIVRHAVERLESRTLLSSTLNEGAGTATISGFVYDDLNGNGHLDAGEPAMPGTTVTLAQVGVNYMGNPFPTVQADINGNVSFTGLAAGQYQLAINPPDPTFTVDAPGQLLVTVSANDIVTLNLGETMNPPVPPPPGTAIISGTLFADTNENGVQDMGEGFLSGDTVFIDLNGNGIDDAGEPSTFTDTVGHFSFTEPAGSYELRTIPRPGFHQDAPGVLRVTVYAGDTPTTNVGENNKTSISGTVFQDLNGNAVQDLGEPPVAGEIPYLDVAGTGSPGRLGTAQDDPGTPSPPFPLTGNQILLDPLDSASAGAYDGDPIFLIGGSGAPEQRTITAYDNINNIATVNTNWDTPPDSSTTYVIVTQPFAMTDSTGHYSFNGLTPGFYRLKVFSLSGMVQDGLGYVDVTTTPTAEDAVVNLPEGLPSTITGVIYSDRNGNGVQDAGDVGLIGQTAYIDLSDNGIINSPNYSITAARETNDIVTITSTAPVNVGDNVTIQGVIPTDYNGSFTVQTVTPNGFTYQDAQGGFDFFNIPPGTSFGKVLLPSATAPAIGPDGMTITNGEPAGISGNAIVANGTPNGSYTINDLGPGTYTVRLVVPEGAVATGPANASHSFTITLGSGQNLATQDFGLQSPDLTIAVLSLPTRAVFAGTKERAVVRITNVGELPAFGTADIALLAQTTNAVVNTMTASMIGTFSDVPIHLRPGQSRVLSFAYSFPIQTPTNLYFVSAGVTSKNVEDDNPANNFSPAIGPISVTLPFIDLNAGYGFPITAATEVGDIVTITSKAPVAIGQTVTIENVVPSQYNGTFRVKGITPTGFTYQDLNATTGVDNANLAPASSFGDAVGPPTNNPPATVDPGQSASISIVVTNMGNVTSTGIVAFRVYLTQMPQLSSTDVINQKFIFKNARIRPGRSQVFRMTLPSPGPAIGARFIVVAVDSGDELGETNLANNIVVPLAVTVFN